MKVPSLVWLQGPWSPVGYDVVELPANSPGGRRDIPEPPRSPLGYRVVDLDAPPGSESPGRPPKAEPPPPRRPELPDRPMKAAPASRDDNPPRRQPRRLGRWAAFAVSGSCLAALALVLVLVRLPAQGAPLPGAPAAALGGLWLADRQEPDQRETFGTAVAFVRNAPEAGRIADKQHKLLFLLHVSGNFEDAGFT